MLKEIFLKKSSTVNNSIITLGDTDDSGKGRHFKSRFIQPGVAGYPGQFGNVLITKESLDKFIYTMVGVPVVINHKDITKDNADDERVGVVNSVWYDDKDGWYWCDGIIWNETAQNLITDKKWNVSCSYDVLTANDEGGTENNIKYDMEFLDGVFTHLALVNNPRYERANIVFNSKTVIENYRSDQKRDKGGRWTKEDYNAEIDKILRGEYPRAKQIRVKDKPSEIWLKVGLQDAEITLPVGVYEKSTKDKHNVSEKTMRNLPDLLDDPLYIFKSSTQSDSFVGVLDDFEDDNGTKKPVIASIKPVDGKTEVNILTSVYGKDKGFTYREILKGNLLYDKSKNNKTASNSVVASIATETLKPSIDIITYIEQNFNSNVKEHEDMNNVDNARGFNGEEGDWITVKGVHVFVKKGQSKEDAVKEFVEKKQGESSGKQEVKKEDRYKVGDTVRYNGTTWVKIEKIEGNSAIVSPIHKEDIDKKRFGEREQVPLKTLQSEDEVHKNYYDGKSQPDESDKGDKAEKKEKRGDLGEDSPRHIYGKRQKDSIPVALKTTYYPGWNKEEVVKEFDSEEAALDYAEERGEAVKRDYENKTKTAQEYGLATWVTPRELEHIKKHGYYPDDDEVDELKESSGKKQSKVRDFYEKEYKEALKEIAEGKDYAQINYDTTLQEMKLALSYLKKHDTDWDAYDIDTNINEYSDLSDKWNKEQIGRIAREKAAQDTLKKWISEGKDRKNEYYKIYEPSKYKPEDNGTSSKNIGKNIKESRDEHGRLVLSKEGTNKMVKIHKNGNFYLASYGQELKDDDGYTEFQLFPSASGKSFKTEQGARKWAAKMLVDNSKEQDMAIIEELKKLITKVENDKGEDMDEKEIKEVENEKVDKRKLIDEVGGILKGKVDDEIIRTIIGKLEKVAYDDSEESADNKKVKNEGEEEEKAEEVKEDVKEDVENKCGKKVHNAKKFYDAINEIYNSSVEATKEESYVSRAQREQAAIDYFK